jgi:hypothetical protein
MTMFPAISDPIDNSKINDKKRVRKDDQLITNVESQTNSHLPFVHPPAITSWFPQSRVRQFVLGNINRATGARSTTRKLEMSQQVM